MINYIILVISLAGTVWKWPTAIGQFTTVTSTTF
jgi:hypothetical protein